MVWLDSMPRAWPDRLILLSKSSIEFEGVFIACISLEDRPESSSCQISA